MGSPMNKDTVVLPTLRSRLFRKYAALFVLAVGIALLASGAIEVWSLYRDHTAWLIRIQHAWRSSTAIRAAPNGAASWPRSEPRSRA